MAQITYTVPLQPIERTETIMQAIATHFVSWAQNYNASLISIVRNGPNVEYTFSNPLPQAELRAIRAEVT